MSWNDSGNPILVGLGKVVSGAGTFLRTRKFAVHSDVIFQGLGTS